MESNILSQKALDKKAEAIEQYLKQQEALTPELLGQRLLLTHRALREHVSEYRLGRYKTFTLKNAQPERLMRNINQLCQLLKGRDEEDLNESQCTKLGK